MDLTTTLFLATDGLTNGAVYTLVGLSLVLVYTTTRVVNIAQGEYVTFGALTLASFVEGTLAPVVYVVAAGGAACLLLDLLRARANGRSLLRPLASYLAAGAGRAGGAGLARALAAAADAGLAGAGGRARPHRLPADGRAQPGQLHGRAGDHRRGRVHDHASARAAAVGRRSARRAAHQRGAPELAGVDIAAQSLFIMAFSLAAALALYLFFRCTLTGKALRAARSTGKARSTAASPW